MIKKYIKKIPLTTKIYRQIIQFKRYQVFKKDFNDSSIESLFCMHVIEHIGLGRYGDPINPDGKLIAIKELKRVLTVSGNLLFVVPIGGKPKIQFNAHRVYSYEQIMNYFKEFTLIEFALIPDYSYATGIIRHASQQMANEQTYGCGCFWFRK